MSQTRATTSVATTSVAITSAIAGAITAATGKRGGTAEIESGMQLLLGAA